MKVAIICFADPEDHPGYWPGIERLAEGIIYGLKKSNIDYTLITSSNKEDEISPNKISLKAIRFGLLGMNILHFSKRLNELDYNKYDIIQIVGYSIYPGLIKNKEFYHKLVPYFAHYDPPRISVRYLLSQFWVNLMGRKAFQMSKGSILGIPKNSKESHEFFEFTRMSESDKEFLFSEEGVILENFNFIQRKMSSKLKLLYVGPLTPRKGVDLLIRAFARINNIDNYTLTIVGGGYYANQLKSLVLKLKLGKYISFTGYLPEIHLEKYFHDHNVFVFPSIREGYPLAPMEAMATGLPVVGYSLSTMKEIVGKTGLLCEIGSIECLTEMLSNLNGSEILKMGYEARKRIEKKFDWETIVKEKYIPYYEFIKNRQ
jgi:glycosyltransferase involved in cell wall biosynthesis